MKSTPLTLTLAAVMAMGVSAPASAQYVDPNAEREYRERVDQYNDEVQDYDRRRNDYASQQSDYAVDQAEYQRQLADYERARADYDRRYGWGAYERRYGVFVYRPVYDDYAYRDRYVYRGYDRDWSRWRDNPCERRRDSRTAGGLVIGALAGAAIGQAIGGDTEGTVLGAIAGGAIGASVGRSTAHCDSRGYYYTYDQTYPYREAAYYRGRRSGRYDWNYYERRRCRLAVAPTYYRGEMEYRYVRVCPDSRGRYRITD